MAIGALNQFFDATWPKYREGDFRIRNYVFRSGETPPELKLHYRTLGTAKRNTAGKIVNGQYWHRS